MCFFSRFWKDLGVFWGAFLEAFLVLKIPTHVPEASFFSSLSGTWVGMVFVDFGVDFGSILGGFGMLRGAFGEHFSHLFAFFCFFVLCVFFLSFSDLGVGLGTQNR
jgi:hypothetical protein